MFDVPLIFEEVTARTLFVQLVYANFFPVCFIRIDKAVCSVIRIHHLYRIQKLLFFCFVADSSYEFSEL